jgi:hypothetical protein
MLKHWELTPKQVVTLVRQDGFRMPAQFLFRDTIRGVFKVPGPMDGWQREFQLAPNGGLIAQPTTADQLKEARNDHDFGSPRCFGLALKKCSRWKIVPRTYDSK